MKEVTRDIFYNTIGPQDIVLSVMGNFPYTTEFKLRSGPLKGKTVDIVSLEPDEPYMTTKYYLVDN